MKNAAASIIKKARRRPAAAALLILAMVVLVAMLCTLAGWLGYRDAQLVPVLLYHNISAGEDVSGDVSARVFAGEMRFLHDSGYHVIPLRQLIDHMDSGASLPDKPVVITFDDGYKSNYTYALPVLKQYSQLATVFWSGMGMGDPNMLTWDEMREMEKSGLVEIQTHTFRLHREVDTEPSLEVARPAVITPAYLPEEDRYESEAEFEEKLRTDFANSREAIEANLQHDTDILSWPYGAYNHRAIKLASEAGFKYFVTLHSGMNRRGESTQELRRIDCGGNIPLSQFQARVDPDRSLRAYLYQVLIDYHRRVVEIRRWGW
jgi:poly-beta-1,6-N-acetyl-D-glucosamine N-deacetylase PgaB